MSSYFDCLLNIAIGKVMASVAQNSHDDDPNSVSEMSRIESLYYSESSGIYITENSVLIESLFKSARTLRAEQIKIDASLKDRVQLYGKGVLDVISI
jgi:hypothetical protein